MGRRPDSPGEVSGFRHRRSDCRHHHADADADADAVPCADAYAYTYSDPLFARTDDDPTGSDQPDDGSVAEPDADAFTDDEPGTDKA
jgi:hypothetical protein